MFDWTLFTKNPNDEKTQQAVREYLRSIRIIQEKGNALDFVLREITGKKVLDIGICEHSVDYIESSGWKHNQIRRVANKVVGLDILEGLIDLLRLRGYDVIHMDATSQEFMGELFDAVVIGDVIEHVNNPVALLQFAGRHLSSGGRIYVSTPNPLYRNIYCDIVKHGELIVNLEHLFWITPTMALESARRAGLNLINYVCFINKSRIMRSKFFRRAIPEIHTADYLYILEI